VNRTEYAIFYRKFNFVSIKRAINRQKILLKLAAIVAIATSSPLILGASPSLATPVPACLSISTITSPGRPRLIFVANKCNRVVSFRVVPLGVVTFPPFPQTCYHLAPGQIIQIVVPFNRFILERC
jgi:hypothetical protein